MKNYNFSANRPDRYRFTLVLTEIFPENWKSLRVLHVQINDVCDFSDLEVRWVCHKAPF